jgi:hypothetical protein
MRISDYDDALFQPMRRDSTWQDGAFIIPRSDWGKLHQDIVEIHNAHRRQWFALANEVHPWLVKQTAGEDSLRTQFFRNPKMEKLPRMEAYEISRFLFQGHSDNVYSPKKKELKLASKYDPAIHLLSNVRVAFVGSERAIRWTVTSFASLPVYDVAVVDSVMRRILSTVWTFGSGGAIYTSEGNVGFGPLGQAFIGNQASDQKE